MTLHKASDGSTLTRAQLNALTTPVTDSDPLVTITEDVVEDVQVPGGAGTRTQRRRLFRAGQIVRTSQLDALYATPTVTAVAPVAGAAAGGTQVTITGSGFDRGDYVNPGEMERASATVTFGGVAATGVVVLSDSEIACTAPPHAAGAVTVQVTSPAGSGSKATAFTYA